MSWFTNSELLENFVNIPNKKVILKSTQESLDQNWDWTVI